MTNLDTSMLRRTGPADELSAENAQAEMRRRQEASTIISLLRPLSSLRLTVVLFALALFLVFAGTLAQVDKGILSVMNQYFRTPIAWVELQVFFPRSWEVPGSFPFPGGYLIGGLMLLNLIAAHAVRFTVKAEGVQLMRGLVITGVGVGLTMLLLAEVHFAVPMLHDFYWELVLICIVTWVLWWGCKALFSKRAGIVLLHAGIIFMLCSEMITGLFAYEANMAIREGAASNFTESPHFSELAFVDLADKEHHSEVVIPQKMLRQQGVIDDPRVPVIVQVLHYMPNSGLVDSTPDNPAAKQPQIVIKSPSSGNTFHVAVVEKPEGTGVSAEQRIDVPAADVILKDRKTGAEIGKYRLSGWHVLHEQPMEITVDGKKYSVALRQERQYKPYALTLIDFKHEKYIGTNLPKDFSSYVRLIDPDHRVDREARIWMNNPLRYRGETFFQSAFLPGDAGTVLQVVQNPGRLVPYLSTVMVAGGLIGHFWAHLVTFLRKQQQRSAA